MIINIFYNSFKELKKIRSITIAGILAALYAISYTPFLGNFAIIPGKLEIRFGYIILAIAGMLLGPITAPIVAIVGDILGTVLFYGGDFFFGYTLTWVVQAFIFGVAFYHMKFSMSRVIISMTLNSVLVNLILSTLWQSFLYGATFWAVLIEKLPINAITILPKSLLLYFIIQNVSKLLSSQNKKFPTAK